VGPRAYSIYRPSTDVINQRPKLPFVIFFSLCPKWRRGFFGEKKKMEKGVQRIHTKKLKRLKRNNTWGFSGLTVSVHCCDILRGSLLS
jgi:hypothetical protein